MACLDVGPLSVFKAASRSSDKENESDTPRDGPLEHGESSGTSGMQIRRQRSGMNMISACGVLCSVCPAYLGQSKGVAHQTRTAEAWNRIYGLNETPEHISCCGCLGPEEEVFYTCRRCKARNCCRSKGFGSCAECRVGSCADLEKAQAGWDGVPGLVNKISAADFDTYARPYCGHRERLAAERAAHRSAK
jgi:hypothetical protein